MSVGAMVAVVMLAEALLHYAPWEMLLGGRKLPRVAAYVLGVLGLMLPFTAWLWERGEAEILVALWVVLAAGGVTVAGLYVVDWVIELVWRVRESAEREQDALMLLLQEAPDAEA